MICNTTHAHIHTYTHTYIHIHRGTNMHSIEGISFICVLSSLQYYKACLVNQA